VKERIQSAKSWAGDDEFATRAPGLALILFAVIQFGIVFNNYIR
jgi:hypothetical protein